MKNRFELKFIVTNDLTRWDKVECPVGGGRGQLMDTDWYRDLKYGGV